VDTTILMIFILVWLSARKKWRYDFKLTKELPVYHTVLLQTPSETLLNINLYVSD